MTTTMKNKQTTFDVTLLFVRVLLGTIMAAHGAQKLLGWFGGFGFEGTMGYFTGTVGLPYLLALLIILAESVGMIALAFGFLSRIVSGGLVLIMIGAVVTTHLDHGFFMNWFGVQGGEGYEYHLLVIALAMIVVLNGAGRFSIDHWLLQKFSFSTRERKPGLV
jgi:putative oxidoreductase